MRNANNTPLTREQVQFAAPALFSQEAYPGMSGRYRFVNSSNIFDGLAGAGFGCVEALQSSSRDPGRRPFARHMAKFRPLDAFKPSSGRQVGDLTPEVVVVNSHDGTSSYWIYAGLFRLVCRNGMVVRDAEFADVRVRHNSRQLDDVLEGVYRVVEVSRDRAEKCLDWRSIAMGPAARTEFAEAAIAARWPENPPVTPAMVLATRRSEDEFPSLYHTFQAVQENILKGVRALPKRRAGAVRSIAGSIEVSQALFALADETARRLK